MKTLETCQTMEVREQLERISDVKKIARIATILLVCFTILVVFKAKYTTHGVFQPFRSAKFLEEDAHNITTKDVGVVHNVTASVVTSEQNNSSVSSNYTGSEPINHDHNLIDELAASFDKHSCISRYQSSSFRKSQPYEPSPYLISKLRSYQELHARCGPNTSSYRQTIRKLTQSSHFNETVPCKYLVWTPANGLGNRMVSIASAFLYAVLEHRVLLVEFEADMDDLFCEPFPGSSWILPKQFPHKHFWTSLPSFKSMVHSGDVGFSPPFVHLDLQHGRDDYILRHFHCNHTQNLLENIPTLILISDQYFIPSLFMAPMFEEELNKMFPQKGSVFHLIGTYLFHPSNEAWGLISRFYQAYLAKADQKIGFQIRAFPTGKVPYGNIMSQIVACSLDNNILPSLDTRKSVKNPSQNLTSKSKAVLVASLYPEFSEELRSMYWTRPTSTGEVIGVYQPSHEEYQKFSDSMHNMKAWAEMYLLSLCNVLVTSGQSTFGYVAQGLGGSNAWMLGRLGGDRVQNPACKRTISMEPCFHVPPQYDCSGKIKINNFTALNPHVKACEDLWWGIKLVDA